MKRFFTAGLLCMSLIANAQDRNYVASMIDSLCSPQLHGRGYVSMGDRLAAEFIERELQRLNPKCEVQTQDFELSVNTFPGDLSVTINDVALKNGVDFMIDPASNDARGQFDCMEFKAKWAEDQYGLFAMIADGKFAEKVIVFRSSEPSTAYKNLINDIKNNPLKAAGYVLVTDQKLTWSVSRGVAKTFFVHVRDEVAPRKIKSIDVAIDQEYKRPHLGVNVVATLKGTADTNAILVFTAHLDHLGRMGRDVYIAGANDNASGSAMLLDLYRYYLKNRPEQDVVFIWFGGEEAGLVGSQHFVEHPLIPLENIQFLLNLDLMGDAATGITAVNGKIFESHFAKLSSLNIEMGLLGKVKARGEAANSDHYPFYQKGVPCFFIYTTGDYKHYHDVEDVPANLPLTNYEQVFELLTVFMKSGV